MLWEGKLCPALGGGKVSPRSQHSGRARHPPFPLVLHQPSKKPRTPEALALVPVGIHRAELGPDRGRGDAKGHTEDLHR